MEPIVEKIVKKYGKANTKSPAFDGKTSSLRWESEDTSNVLSILLDDGRLTIGLSSAKVTKALNELKAKKSKSKIDD